MFCPVKIASKSNRTIELVHSAIEDPMRLPQLRGHGIDIVEVGSR